MHTLQRGAAVLAQGWRKLTRRHYRPEKHYMRGPGPKWRAKYARIDARLDTHGPQDAAPGR